MMPFETVVYQPPALLAGTMRVGRSWESPERDLGDSKGLFILKYLHSPSKSCWKGLHGQITAPVINQFFLMTNILQQ